MLDTNTINYGINKLTSAFATIQPTLNNLTEQYVKYTVTSEVIRLTMLIIITLIVGLLFIPLFIYGKGKNGYDNYNNINFICPCVLLCMVGGLLIMVDCINIYYTILAVQFPEMYTIQHLICNK